MKSYKTIAVFLGPSLRREEAHKILDADYYPPASKGDIYKIIASGVRVIILIDGIFHSTPSVWQRELLDALDEGIQVYGASSMGALRAAELHSYGMVGHGTIFEWYRDGVIDGDDEVALLHASEEFGFQAQSEPLVNIRYTLSKAVDDGYLQPSQSRELIEYAGKLPYPDRSIHSLLQCPLIQNWPPQHQAALEGYLKTSWTDLKRQDAVGVLQLVAASKGIAATCGPKSQNLLKNDIAQNVEAESTARFLFFDQQRLLLTGFVTPQGIVTGSRVLEEARKDQALMETLREKLTRRRFVLEWARQNRITCPPEILQAYLDSNDGERHDFTNGEWLRANGLTFSAYRKIWKEQGLADWITRQGPSYFGLEPGIPDIMQNEPGLLGTVDGKAASETDHSVWFVLEWARQNGVQTSLPASLPEEQGSETANHIHQPIVRIGSKDTIEFERWILTQGPAYFGIEWSFETALLQELQFEGIAARLAQDSAESLL